LNRELINTWQELLSRIMTGVAAYAVWRMVTLDFKELEEKVELVHINKLLTIRHEAINGQAALINENERRMRIIRHDMRHNIRILSSLIQSGETDAALEMLRGADESIKAQKLIRYCENENINAVLTVYIELAKEVSADVVCEADVPEKTGFDSNDIAILTANVIENAIQAVENEPEEKRIISIKIRYFAHKLCLEVANRCTRQVVFSQDGSPVTTKDGHGIGFSSIRAIIKKYDADMVCTHEDDVFQISCLFCQPKETKVDVE
ncbi:MAG: ATP-binding protein, partial [Planctomycetia bacterium]|nr:ATP-binding protein [Planctomycetia bacterium]